MFQSNPSEVLIAGRHCGTLPFANPQQILNIVERVSTYNFKKSWEDYSYATKCYKNTSATGCDFFAQPAIPFTVDSNAPCPFASEMCESGRGNLLLDTSEVDSYSHLGLNRGPRFTLRYRTHCAPILTQNFTQRSLIPNSTRVFKMYNFSKNRDDGQTTYWVEQDDRSVKTYIGAYKLR